MSFTLTQSVTECSTGYIDQDLRAYLQRLLLVENEGDYVSLSTLQTVLESLRSIPKGDARRRAMNTFVRTVGEPSNLAALLDSLSFNLNRDSGTSDSTIAQRSVRGRMHCVYGWAGQTLMFGSDPEPTPATTPPDDSVDDFLGYPPAQWDMSIHIWQPNPGARKFAFTKVNEPGVVVEPPHSHPFDFISYVSVGHLVQSTYAEISGNHQNAESAEQEGRYKGVELRRVDGVWPPHAEDVPAYLRTLDNRVNLAAGNSYYLPSNVVHDVEVAIDYASKTPAITLFLCAEATVKPNAYMAPSMVEFHHENQDLKDQAVALSPNQWKKKLECVADYLRGRSSTLILDSVVSCTSEYGFMHQV